VVILYKLIKYKYYNKMGKHKKKVCAQCAKVNSVHWAKHWMLNHKIHEIVELKDGCLPVSPFCSDWFARIPEDIKKLYPKTLARLGSNAQKPNEKMKSLELGE
jgi:hypothetical protein